MVTRKLHEFRVTRAIHVQKINPAVSRADRRTQCLAVSGAGDVANNTSAAKTAGHRRGCPATCKSNADIAKANRIRHKYDHCYSKYPDQVSFQHFLSP